MSVGVNEVMDSVEERRAWTVYNPVLMVHTPYRKLAVLLHADVVGSTALVQQDETLAHQRIQDTFRRISETLTRFGGIAHEIRGDALVAEFSKASDAVSASLAFQVDNNARNELLNDGIQPVLRVGIAMGEVVVGDHTVTGEGVVLAQRLEQLARPGGVCVQGAVYETIPKRLPFTYENLGEQKLKGFSDPIRVYSASLKPGTELPELDSLIQPAIYVPRRPEIPSIAVLPFTNMSGDPEQEYFADGMAEDIITDLSRFKDLLVIARDSSFSYKARSIKIQELARELGVRYVLEGSVRKAGKHLRITAQLVDSSDESHLWAERYDRESRDLFVIQDEIVETIVRTVAARVERHDLERADRKVPQDLNAYDFVLQARAILCDSAENNRHCRKLYESALRIDPRSSAACSGLAMTHGLDHTSGWSESPEWSLDQAISYASRAVALDDDNSEGHYRLGSQQLFNREYDLAEFHLDKALVLNPNDAAAWAYKGLYFIYTGQPLDAHSSLEQAIRRNPYHSVWYLWFVGLAHYCSRQYQEATLPLRHSINRSPKFIAPRRHLAACYAQLGNSRCATEQTLKILELEPGFSITKLSKTLCYRNSSDLEHYLDGLRKAGLPE